MTGETAIVVDGPLRFVCAGRVDELADGDSVTFDADLPHHFENAGDCVTFDADLPHHFANPGKEEAVLLAIVSAGLRRS